MFQLRSQLQSLYVNDPLGLSPSKVFTKDQSLKGNVVNEVVYSFSMGFTRVDLLPVRGT